MRACVRATSQYLGTRTGRNYHPPEFSNPIVHSHSSGVNDIQPSTPKTFAPVNSIEVSELYSSLRYINMHEETHRTNNVVGAYRPVLNHRGDSCPDVGRHTHTHENIVGEMGPSSREHNCETSVPDSQTYGHACQTPHENCATAQLRYRTSTPSAIHDEQHEIRDGSPITTKSTMMSQPPELQSKDSKDREKLSSLEDKIASLTDAVSKLATMAVDKQNAVKVDITGNDRPAGYCGNRADNGVSNPFYNLCRCSYSNKDCAKASYCVNANDYICCPTSVYNDRAPHILNKHVSYLKHNVPTCNFFDIENTENSNSSFEDIVRDSRLTNHNNRDAVPHPLHNIAFKGMQGNLPKKLGNNILHDSNISLCGEYSQCGSEHHILATRANNILGGSGNSEVSRKFSGNALEYEAWHIRVSQEIINKEAMPTSALEYIVSQTSGKPKDVVISMASVEFQTSWSLILSIFSELKRQFAPDHLVRKAIESEIHAFPQVTEDIASLNSFVNLCRKVELHKSVCRDLMSFDMCEGTNILRAKLPKAVQEFYGNKWCEYEQRYGTSPPLAFFISCIKKYRDKQISSRYAPIAHNRSERAIRMTEARTGESIKTVDKDDVTNRAVQMGPVQKSDKSVVIQESKDVNRRSTNEGTNDTKSSSSQIGNNKPYCSVHKCDGHSTVSCLKFINWPLIKRREFAKSEKLCFKCLGLYHRSNLCYSKNVCVHCGKNHNSLLCFEGSKNENEYEGRVGCTQICNDATRSAYCTKVLLVDIALDSDPQKTLRTYAVLDDQSDTTLIDEKVVDYFGGTYPTRNVTTNFVTSKAKFKHDAKVIPKIRIKGVGCNRYEVLSNVLTYPEVSSNKHQVASPEVFQRFKHAAQFAEQVPDLDNDAEVLVLVGLDNFHLHKTWRLTKKAPYVYKTPIGFALVGKVCEPEETSYNSATVLRTQTLTNPDPLEVVEPFKVKSDFSYPATNFDVLECRPDDEETGWSKDDHTFFHIMKEGEVVSDDGKLTYPLPLVKDSDLPCNRDVIFRRTCGTLRNIMKSDEKVAAVCKIMEEDLKSGNGEQISDEPRFKGSEWYLPPFVVTHKRKGTPRIVYDAAAEFESISLNKCLLQGPDMLSKLRCVLLRFREKKVCITADIKGMFLNFQVAPEHRRFLRFFWWRDNDCRKDIVPYQINTHAFGLKSSPAVANFALHSIADKVNNNSEDMNLVSSTLRSSFYVDDLLTSTDTEREAASLITGLTRSLSLYDIRLHKFASSHRQALCQLPEDYLTSGMRGLPDDCGNHSALGVKWDPVSDMLSLTLSLPQKEFTRRGILSVIGSLYDPVGFLAPLILGGRLFQREVLSHPSNLDGGKILWDAPLPPILHSRWHLWCSSLQGLESLSIPRCLYPTTISPVSHYLCVFADASDVAMGYVIYLLTEDSEGGRHLGFICGNSRVAPKGCTTIPRMELNAALLAARTASEILKSFTIKMSGTRYFTDSKIVLGYLRNTTTSFKNYVERRIRAIKQLTSVDDWFYVPSANNPADYATRPSTPQQLASSIWFTGPQFIITGKYFDDESSETLPEEIKEASVRATSVKNTVDLCTTVLTRTLSLQKAACVMRRILSLRHKLDKLRQRRGVQLAPRDPFPPVLSGIAYLISSTQSEHYKDELHKINQSEAVSEKSPLNKLSPWVDGGGLIRMDGRLQNSALPWEVSYPVILPSHSNLAKAVMLHFHKETHHQGCTITRSAIQRGGYHIVGGSKLLKTIIYNCTMCRRLRGKAQEQKMSFLPSTRVLPSERPFTHIGVDVFGHFHIKDTVSTRRHNSTTKMWGCVFTCCSSRAVHLEPLASLDTSSFLNAFLRFCAIRGRPSSVRSDRGGNFVSASKTLGTIDIKILEERMNAFNIKWEFNVPFASHFGGIWERMIGSTRRVMEGMLSELHSKTFDWETFITLLSEASRIINNTPLWVTSWDSGEPAPLCPADLLMISDCNNLVGPPTPSSERDLLTYGHRRHLRATYLVGCFWSQWERDYLVTLNQRSKWFRRKNIEEGDIVLLIDKNLPRSLWPMATIYKVNKSSDSLVRTVTLRVGGSTPRFIERPIDKTISLLPKSYYSDLSSNGDT